MASCRGQGAGQPSRCTGPWCRSETVGSSWCWGGGRAWVKTRAEGPSEQGRTACAGEGGPGKPQAKPSCAGHPC